MFATRKTTLAALRAPFAAWTQATGIALNHKKTVIVPLNAASQQADTSTHARVTEYAQTLPPPWNETNIKTATARERTP